MSQSDEEEFASATLSEAIENQIRDGNPDAAKQALERLMLAGHERADAIALMTAVLAVEVRALLNEERAFDSVWYAAALQALPELPELPELPAER